jgi:putative transcriptional regulator
MVAGAENRHASVMSDPLSTSLRGQLLVAAPALVDPNFRRTVVLVGDHGEEGAMGIVLNRPSGVSVAEAVEPLVELVGGDELVFVGGPVQPEAIVVLGEFEQPEHAASLVLGEIGFLPGEIESGEDVGPLGRVRVFAGYAGWGAGQLEGELAESSWIVEAALPEDVFAADPDALWSDVLRRKGGPYAVLSLMPPDPSLN